MNLSDHPFLRTQLETQREWHGSSPPFIDYDNVAITAAFDNYGPLLQAVLDVLEAPCKYATRLCQQGVDSVICPRCSAALVLRAALSRASQPEVKP